MEKKIIVNNFRLQQGLGNIPSNSKPMDGNYTRNLNHALVITKVTRFSIGEVLVGCCFNSLSPSTKHFTVYENKLIRWKVLTLFNIGAILIEYNGRYEL